MMRKILDQFLDKSLAEVAAIARQLNADAAAFRAVRLVSHHLRLLSLLHQDEAGNWIILVDYDDTK